MAKIVSVYTGYVPLTCVTFGLDDGRGVTVPIAWLPWLEGASEAQRAAFTIATDGESVRWPEFDSMPIWPGGAAVVIQQLLRL